MWKEPTEKYKGHPTPKPIKLMERLIQASSKPEDIVLDLVWAVVLLALLPNVVGEICGY